MLNRRKDQPEFIAALQYFKVQQIFKIEKNRVEPPAQILEIKYEDFIHNPENIIKKTLNFCELTYQEEIFKYLKNNKLFDRGRRKDTLFAKEIDEKIIEIIYSEII